MIRPETPLTLSLSPMKTWWRGDDSCGFQADEKWWPIAECLVLLFLGAPFDVAQDMLCAFARER